MIGVVASLLLHDPLYHLLARVFGGSFRPDRGLRGIWRTWYKFQRGNRMARTLALEKRVRRPGHPCMILTLGNVHNSDQGRETNPALAKSPEPAVGYSPGKVFRLLPSLVRPRGVCAWFLHVVHARLTPIGEASMKARIDTGAVTYVGDIVFMFSHFRWPRH